MSVILPQRTDAPFIAVVLGLTTGVFVLDLALPLGIAVPMLYAIPLLLTSKDLSRRFTLGLAAVASCLTVLGFLLSSRGPELWPAVANRSLSLVTIWVTTILVILNKRAVQGQQDQETQRRLLLEQLPALLWVADTNLTITFVQGRILSTLGLTPEGIVGTTVPEYFPVEPISTPFATHLRALQVIRAATSRPSRSGRFVPTSSHCATPTGRSQDVSALRWISPSRSNWKSNANNSLRSCEMP